MHVLLLMTLYIAHRSLSLVRRYIDSDRMASSEFKIFTDRGLRRSPPTPRLPLGRDQRIHTAPQRVPVLLARRRPGSSPGPARRRPDQLGLRRTFARLLSPSPNAPLVTFLKR